MPVLEPGIYIVSTPIGNLGDLSQRQIEVLSSCDYIACEDTRRSKNILFKLKIKKPLISYHDHNELKRSQALIEYVLNGNSIAVISDAGTPGISDPAYRVVSEGIKNNIPIVPIPGPCSIIAALVASGLPTDRFIFEGFLPPKKGRKKRIENFKNESGTIIIYENTLMLNRTIRQILEIIGDRPAVLCRELTKIHEEKIRGTLSSLLDLLNRKKLKGECVLLIGKDDKNVYFE